MKIAIVVGHDKINQGAFSNILKQSEFAFNNEVAKLLPYDVYFRNEKIKGYKSQMQELAKRINEKRYDLVIELHFNMFNGKAKGCECLYLKGSKIGKEQAEKLCKSITKDFGNINRGAVAIDNEKGRGYWFLKLINAPALIVEPFFGDNEETIAFKNKMKYAKTLIDNL